MNPVSELKHPLQPLGKAPDGVVRFKANQIVRFLLDAGPFDMNQLAFMDFSAADREQFAQLIGYSLSGFGELSYVSDQTYTAAERMALQDEPEGLARLTALENQIKRLKSLMRPVVSALYPIHPDDLL